MCLPFTLISKCKCGPVELPVEPTSAITSPALTSVPALTYILFVCAYQVSTPFPWSTFTKLPYEPLYLAKVTIPSATTFIGVPFFADISKPVCLELLILLLTPYLDVILPDIGVTANLIPLISGSASILSCSSCFSIISVTFV